MEAIITEIGEEIIDDNQVILINAMVDFVRERPVNGYAKSTMKSIGGDVFV